MRESWVVVFQVETLHRLFLNVSLIASPKNQNNILKIVLAPWYREWPKQWKYISFMEIKLFVFSVESFDFLNFMKKRPNLTNATLWKVWPWHMKSKIHKITGKIGFKFCKLTFFRGKWPSYSQIFLNTRKIPKVQKVLNSGKVCWHLLYWIHWLR